MTIEPVIAEFTQQYATLKSQIELRAMLCKTYRVSERFTESLKSWETVAVDGDPVPISPMVEVFFKITGFVVHIHEVQDHGRALLLKLLIDTGNGERRKEKGEMFGSKRALEQTLRCGMRISVSRLLGSIAR